jgi:hypothetical protein
MIHRSFERPCEGSPTKRVLNFTLSTVTPLLRTDYWHSLKRCLLFIQLLQSLFMLNQMKPNINMWKTELLG